MRYVLVLALAGLCSCATIKASEPTLLDCAKAPAAQSARDALNAALAKDVAAVAEVAKNYAEDVVNCALAVLEADLDKQVALSTTQASLSATPSLAQHKLSVLHAYQEAR